MGPIVTNVNSGKRYVLLHFLKTNKYSLIPYDGSKYWEHYFVPINEWITINDSFDFSEFDIDKKWFDDHVTKGMIKYKQITQNFHNKFK